MKLEVSGVVYENFLSASVEIRLDALSNTFSFEAVATQGMALPFKGGEPCRVLVDDESVLTGYIEIVSVNYDNSSHTISIQGRDKTGDLLDSSLLAISDIRSAATLKGVIEIIIKQIGADITVTDNSGIKAFDDSEDIASPEAGDNAFEFIEALARKRQVLLTSDGDGNIVIVKSPGRSSGYSLQNIIGANDNNVLSGSVSYDTTGRFRSYTFASAMNPSAVVNAGTIDLKSLVNQSGGALDDDIRKGRQFVLVSEGPFSGDQDEVRAQWELDIRKARGKVYSAMVQGYRPDGKLWAVNETVNVSDDFTGIPEKMLINTVAFSFDNETGRRTTISCIEENAYNIDLAEPSTESEFSLA